MLASFQNGDFWYGSWQQIKKIATQYLKNYNEY